MYSYTLSLTSALDTGESSVPRLGRFTIGKDPVPTVKEARGAPRPVLTGAENLVSIMLCKATQNTREKDK
jgi:hypothetical protein